MKKNNNAKRVKKNNKKKKNRKKQRKSEKKEEKDKEKLPFVISLVKNYLPYFRNKSDSSGTYMWKEKLEGTSKPSKFYSSRIFLIV